MKTIVVAAGLALAAISATANAQEDPAPGRCFIEVPKLLAAPPTGIADLGAAIRALDEKLRPQVEEINRLKTALEKLQAESQSTTGYDENGEAVTASGASDEAEQQQRLSAELTAKQDQLKLDYDAQRQALVGPVQARVSQRAQVFATERGCTELKMARPPDLAALREAAARDVTGEFVAWYDGGST